MPPKCNRHTITGALRGGVVDLVKMKIHAESTASHDGHTHLLDVTDPFCVKSCELLKYERSKYTTWFTC